MFWRFIFSPFISLLLLCNRMVLSGTYFKTVIKAQSWKQKILRSLHSKCRKHIVVEVRHFLKAWWMVPAEFSICQALSNSPTLHLPLSLSNLFFHPCPNRTGNSKFGLEPLSKNTSASSVPPPHPKTRGEAWRMGGVGHVKKRPWLNLYLKLLES